MKSYLLLCFFFYRAQLTAPICPARICRSTQLTARFVGELLSSLLMTGHRYDFYTQPHSVQQNLSKRLTSSAECCARTRNVHVH